MAALNHWLSLVLGLGLLYVGAQVLIKGGAAIALRLGLNSLVVGLTVIAYGTSSPEMVVSFKASVTGNGAIAIGNVVGSNICNIVLILAVCSLVSPVSASTQVIRREIPITIGVSLLLCVLLWDGSLSRFDGAVLFAGIVAYTVFTVRDARRASAAQATAEYEAEFPERKSSLLMALVLVLLGLGVLVGGSQLFVDGAVKLAQSWGVSQAVIGLTIVAVGTSMPEFATSLVAAFRRHADVAIGNIVGSNIFNILGILGTAAMLQPIDATGISRVDLAVMLVAAVSLFPLARSGGRISRWEGAALLVLYVAYTIWLIRGIGST
ncbi:MAG: calcium/sodium antiporter [Opitutaceae bacterium]|nr:calcium/sodium antiporter [Opitutaceae bacterium]